MRHVGLALVLVLAVGVCVLVGRDATAVQAPAAAPAPPLGGTAADGGFSLDELRGEPAVLVFYRSAGCGLCLLRLQSLDEHRDDYEELGVAVVAITADPPERVERTREELDLGFPIVSVDQSVLAQWGVWPVGEEAPLPAAFLLDEQGRIRFRHIGQTAGDRVSDVALLAAAKRIR